jgi:hypothetical protein
MNTIQNHGLIVQSHPTQLLTHVSPETRQIFSIAEQKGWDFNLLGQAQLPKELVQLDQWLVVPANLDSSEIPARTYKRIQTIFASGIRPKGFVIVHEAPRLLTAPKPLPQHAAPQVFPPEVEKPKTDTSSTDAIASIFSSALFGTIITVIGALFMGIAMIDPIVVAVMEDNCWVEIDRWATKV